MQLSDDSLECGWDHIIQRLRPDVTHTGMAMKVTTGRDFQVNLAHIGAEGMKDQTSFRLFQEKFFASFQPVALAKG